MQLPPIKYLMQELKFKTSDWTALTEQDREDLKRWATAEQEYIERNSSK